MKALILYIITALALSAETLYILNSESDLPAEAGVDYAVLKDYSREWKNEGGEWVERKIIQNYSPAVEEVRNEEDEIIQEAKDEVQSKYNWSDAIFLFDYRFHTGEPPLLNGGKRVLEKDGSVKILKTHNADHQTAWTVTFLGF